jgi:cytochrome b561
MISTATLYTILAGYTVLGGLALVARKPQDAERDRHPKLNFGVGASVAFIGLYLVLANLPLLGWTAMFLGVTLALYAFLEALLTIHDNQQHTLNLLANHDPDQP